MKGVLIRDSRWRLKLIRKDIKYFWNFSRYLITRKAQSEPLIRIDTEALRPDYSRPLCLFCSFDKESVIRESVYWYLKELLLAGFNIIFISTSDTISDVDLEKLSQCCIRIINRENKGYDFYGWKTALEKYPQYQLHKSLLLANDSVIGPLFSMRDLLPKLESYDADIIGMTDCFHFHPHLQSYFIYCKKKVVTSKEFALFFQRVDILDLKIAIIRKYEVGFSRFLGRRFRIAALYDVREVVNRVNYHQKPVRWINPTFHLWKTLITDFKFPFLKRNLLTDNVTNKQEVLETLRTHTSYNVDLLVNWLTQHSNEHEAQTASQPGFSDK